jgi:hypothetical protein
MTSGWLLMGCAAALAASIAGTSGLASPFSTTTVFTASHRGGEPSEPLLV